MNKRAINRVSPALSTKIAEAFSREAEEHPTWSPTKIARKLGKEFYGLADSTIIRHSEGPIKAMKRIREDNPAHYRKKKTNKKDTPISAEAKNRVLKLLLREAAKPSTGDEDRFLMVELADILV